MNQTIERLWNGTLEPCKTCGCGDSEIHELVALTHRNRDALLQTLNDTQRDSFKKYADCFEEYTDLLSAHAFHDGFCLAVRFTSEAFSA